MQESWCQRHKLCTSVAAPQTQVHRSNSSLSHVLGAMRRFKGSAGGKRPGEQIQRLQGGESSNHQHMGLDLHYDLQQQRHCLVTNSLPFPYYVAGGLGETCSSQKKLCGGWQQGWSGGGNPPKLPSATLISLLEKWQTGFLKCF